MTKWQHTELYIGEDLTLPEDAFVTHYPKERIEYCRYAGATDHGIFVEIQFKPGFLSEETEDRWRIKRFFDYAAIYCGRTKLIRTDKSLVRACPASQTVPDTIDRGFHLKWG